MKQFSRHLCETFVLATTPKTTMMHGGVQENGNADLPQVRISKQKFHRGRFLKLKHLPVDVRDEEIRALLGFFRVEQIEVNRAVRTATVTLHSPESLDAWPMDKVWKLRDTTVDICPSSTETALCVAHLPIEYSDEEFEDLVNPYGTVTSCFLVRSEKTGDSKGYGVVSYSSREVAHQARNLLDRKRIEGCTIHCNWLEPSHVTYSSLHSKCLYVDNLPADYGDVADFRQMFSVVASPPYCQIAVKRGQPLGFGLVEFSNSDEAESTQRKLNHFQFEDRKIRVGFCIPGYRAVTIYNRLVSNVSNGKKPLLPDPPFGTSLLRRLPWQAARNPQLAHAICALTAQLQEATRKGDAANFTNGNADGNGSRKHGLLGKGPEDASSLQAALVVLLASQLQMQMGVRQGQNDTQVSENGRGRVKNGNGRNVRNGPSDNRPWRPRRRNPSSGNGSGNGNGNMTRLPERRDDDRNPRNGQKNGTRAPLLPDPVPVLGRSREGGLLPHPGNAGANFGLKTNGQEMTLEGNRTVSPPSISHGRAGLLGDKPSTPSLPRDSPPLPKHPANNVSPQTNPEDSTGCPNNIASRLPHHPVEQTSNVNGNTNARKDLQALHHLLPFLASGGPPRPAPPTLVGLTPVPQPFINPGPNMTALAQLQLQLSATQAQNQRALVQAQTANSAAVGLLLQLAQGLGTKAPVVNGYTGPPPVSSAGAVRGGECPENGLNLAPWWLHGFGMANGLASLPRMPQPPPPLPTLVDPIGAAFKEASLAQGLNADVRGKSSLLGDFWQSSLHSGHGIPNISAAVKRKMQPQLPLNMGSNPIFVTQQAQEHFGFKKKRV